MCKVLEGGVLLPAKYGFSGCVAVARRREKEEELRFRVWDIYKVNSIFIFEPLDFGHAWHYEPLDFAETEK